MARVQNNFVDTAQYQLLSIMHEKQQDELDKRLQAAYKIGFQKRAFDPVALPKPGDRIPSVGVKRGPPGPPVTVCLLWHGSYAYTSAC